ncbi:hypothetical protein A5881_003932 [Enterococcus termitis]
MSVTYPNAFSTELREELSSERAHSLSVKKILSDSKSFQCSEDCSTFKLTLTNFGKKDYIYSPYFRPGSLNQSHAPNCSLMKKNYENRIGTQETSYIFSRIDSNIIVDLNLLKGLLTPSENPTKMTPTSTNVTIGYTSHNGEKELGSKHTYQHIKSLAKLVRLYFDSKEGELYRFFDRNRNEIILSDYFEELYLEKEVVEHKNKIYYGLVNIFKKNPENDPYFHIRFCSPCKIYDNIVTPTVNINIRLATHRGVKKKIQQLDRLCETKEEFTLFYFGSFKYNDPYLNFDKSHQEIIDYLFFRD